MLQSKKNSITLTILGRLREQNIPRRDNIKPIPLMGEEEALEGEEMSTDALDLEGQPLDVDRKLIKKKKKYRPLEEEEDV